MHTFLALVLTVAAAVVVARPPGPAVTTVTHDETAPLSAPTRKYLKDYLLPRYLWPHYFAFDEIPQQAILQQNSHLHHQPPLPATDWLNQEIERLSLMQQRAANPFQSDVPRGMLHDPTYFKRMLSVMPHAMLSHVPLYKVKQTLPAWSLVSQESMYQHALEMNEKIKETNVPVTKSINKEEKKKEFALTPLDQGYFKPAEKYRTSANMKLEGVHEGGGQHATDPQLESVPPRSIRQNPINLSRTKTLVADNLDKLRMGVGHEETVPKDRAMQKVLETATTSPADSFYAVALLSAMGAAAVLAILGFVFGWYTLSKRAKAAADVDYPAYGVTGPTIDTSGDRKLAHSAQMYHYQHQKQQIIAMERSTMEPRNGSGSDPESEDENEEGDYTVYECPGFATTGDMEVKNPLFNEEPTPATPGKCEVVKPQPN